MSEIAMFNKRRLRSFTFASSATFCHFHDVSWNLHLSDIVSPFFSCIYENIFIIPVYGIRYQFQFFAVKLDFLVFGVPVTLYFFAEFP